MNTTLAKDSNKPGMCQASADFAVFSNFGWHRRGDPLRFKEFFLVQSHFFEVGNIFGRLSQP